MTKWFYVFFLCVISPSLSYAQEDILQEEELPLPLSERSTNQLNVVQTPSANAIKNASQRNQSMRFAESEGFSRTNPFLDKERIAALKSKRCRNMKSKNSNSAGCTIPSED